MMTRNELMDLMPREHKTAEIIEVNKYSVVIRVTCPCCGKVFELESKRNIPMKED